MGFHFHCVNLKKRNEQAESLNVGAESLNVCNKGSENMGYRHIVFNVPSSLKFLHAIDCMCMWTMTWFWKVFQIAKGHYHWRLIKEWLSWVARQVGERENDTFAGELWRDMTHFDDARTSLEYSASGILFNRQLLVQLVHEEISHLVALVVGIFCLDSRGLQFKGLELQNPPSKHNCVVLFKVMIHLRELM